MTDLKMLVNSTSGLYYLTLILLWEVLRSLPHTDPALGGAQVSLPHTDPAPGSAKVLPQGDDEDLPPSGPGYVGPQHPGHQE